MVLKHLRRNISFFLYCYSGPQRSLLWSLRQTLAYRRNLRRLNQENRLGLRAQLSDMLSRRRALKLKPTTNEKTTTHVHFADPTEIKIKRVNIPEDVQNQLQTYRYNKSMGRLQNGWTQLSSFVKRTSVKQAAEWCGQQLKVYHKSMSALVQGYREVTMDAEKKFRFEDTNETV